MNKKIILAAIAVISLLAGLITGCSHPKDNNRVVIYSSSEDYRNEYIASRLNEQFPQYDIVLQYLSTGNSAAKLQAEGAGGECDIVLELESGYLEQLKELFAPLDSYPAEQYLDGLVPEHRRYATWYRISGAIIINEAVLKKYGLEPPDSYQALLRPEYKDLISMPNPKASSTGYIFLKSLVNAWGEDEAFAYFDKLSENVVQFTSSGSGPVNALIQQEVAIGLGITYQAVNAINSGSTGLKILYFDEGAPYTTGGFAMLSGKEKRAAVKEVFDFLYNTLIYEDKELFAPEAIFKDRQYTIPNYPADIHYADMSGILDIVEKPRLLEKWKY